MRHFVVMHHMMEKAAKIWSKETGIDRNPADQIEVKRPDDQRERYLSLDELCGLKAALDEKLWRAGSRALNQTFYRLRLVVLIALSTGMRMAEIFALTWSDVLYREELIAVRSKLKGGKIPYPVGDHGTCFAIPMAWTINRCISSAPTSAFGESQNCKGRIFRRSITLEKSSGVSVSLPRR